MAAVANLQPSFSVDNELALELRTSGVRCLLSCIVPRPSHTRTRLSTMVVGFRSAIFISSGRHLQRRMSTLALFVFHDQRSALLLPQCLGRRANLVATGDCSWRQRSRRMAVSTEDERARGAKQPRGVAVRATDATDWL